MRISEALGTTSAKLWQQGVFDSFLGIDSRLHIDPALLRTTRIPEFRHAHTQFELYFNAVLLMLKTATAGGAIERQTISKLTFPEIPSAALGFAEKSAHGRGVSRSLATQLYYTAKEIVEAGINDPAIFELAVVFEEGFGPDLISDMTLFVIRENVSKFNQRVCRNLRIPTKQIVVGHNEITAAHAVLKNREILLIPRTLLAVLPEASCREDIDRVARYNNVVRERLNKMLGKSWSNLAKKLSKHQLKTLFLAHPEMLSSLIDEYKKKRPAPYDFGQDPLGEVVWEEIGRNFGKKHKVRLANPRSKEELAETIGKIVSQFKRLIENNGLAKHLYNDEGLQRPEKFAQLLFFSVADTFCKANNLDLNAEPNAGRGPVDFKVSGGYDLRGVVELKLSSNGKALDGLLAQLPTYAQAEQAAYSCFLLIVVGPSRTRVDAIKREHIKLKKKGHALPDLSIVEAHNAFKAPSASYLKFRF